MISCNILKFNDWTTGIDIESVVWFPPGPPLLPYNTIAPLGYNSETDGKFSKDIVTLGMAPANKGTNIGANIIHIGNPLNVMLPMIVMGSSSKSLFGASTVKLNGSPACTACFGVTNLNLDCSSPVSLPTGIVISFTTVRAGMTIGDYLAGIASMAIQMVLDKMVEKLFSMFAKIPGIEKMKNFLSKQYGKVAEYIARKTPNLQRFAKKVAEYATSKLKKVADSKIVTDLSKKVADTKFAQKLSKEIRENKNTRDLLKASKEQIDKFADKKIEGLKDEIVKDNNETQLIRDLSKAKDPGKAAEALQKQVDDAMPYYNKLVDNHLNPQSLSRAF